MSLVEKISKVQQDIQTVIKGGYNDFNKYAYAREVDIIGEIKPLLGKYRLALTNSGKSITRYTSTDEKQRENETVFVEIEYTLHDLDGKDTLVSIGYGVGKDIGDKAVYKALTGAMKYYLSKTFLVETGDDAENDQKQRGGGKMPQKDNTADFERAKKLIAASRNIDGLIEWAEKLKVNKIFNAKQKEELQALMSSRVEILSNPKE